MSNSRAHTSYTLGSRHFAVTLVFALLLHFSGFVVWKFSPKQQVRDIPIRTMNIRLGEAEELDSQTVEPTFAAPAANPMQMEAVIEQLTRETPLAKPQEAPPVPPTPPVAKDEAKQYVREVNAPRVKKTARGDRQGKRDAEIMSRYTQLISLWIQKFKVYPEEARLQGYKGATVVRMRIDRRGNIVYYALERSTGIELLDKAAIDMIRRANPVPAVPNDYPEGETFEFLIPVNFSLI
jgi:TonB family protein